MCGFLRRSVAAGTGPYVLEMYGDAPYFCVVQEAYAMGEHGLALIMDFEVLDPRFGNCLLYTSPSPRDRQKSRMPSSA